MADYVVEPLSKRHNRADFSCGEEELDRYLKQQASQAGRRDVARVFVLCPGADEVCFAPTTIVGYYTLSATSIEPTNLPSDLAKRMPRYPTLPAILLGRLAIDRRYQGQGIGSILLTSALQRSLRLSTELGAIAVIVDAKHDRARQFYEHYGFQRFIDHEYRLFLPMKTIEQLFAD